jgi:hypothetical protein
VGTDGPRLGGTLTALIRLFQRLRMREVTRTFLRMPEGHEAEFSTGTILSLILFHKSSTPRWKIEIKLDVIFACHVIIF